MLGGGLPLPGRIVTVSPTFWTGVVVRLYKVLTPALLSDTHIGLPELDERPQGFLSCRSTICAGTAPLEPRLVSRNAPLAEPALTPAAGSVMPTAVATASPTVNSLRPCMPSPPCESPFSGRSGPL